jgi:hypothetical protein
MQTGDDADDDTADAAAEEAGDDAESLVVLSPGEVAQPAAGDEGRPPAFDGLLGSTRVHDSSGGTTSGSDRSVAEH